MRKQVETILQALLAASVAVSLMGCAATRPPQRIQDAIHTMNRHMPEYVIEANKALADTEHPDKERLIGMGERLADVVDALDRWASEQEKAQGETKR